VKLLAAVGDTKAVVSDEEADKKKKQIIVFSTCERRFPHFENYQLLHAFFSRLL